MTRRLTRLLRRRVSNLHPTIIGLMVGDVLASLRILIVEDDALIGMLLADMLTAMGHAVCAVARTQDEAVAAAEHHKPHMLIVDDWLHEGSGVTAVDQIQRRGIVPHIFVTGDSRGVLALKPNAIVLEKPFTEAMLSAAIDRAHAYSQTSPSWGDT